MSIRHVRFVRVHVDELPRSQNRFGKQNGELSFLGHAGTPELLDFGRVCTGRRSGSRSLRFLVSQVHEDSAEAWGLG